MQTKRRNEQAKKRKKSSSISAPPLILSGPPGNVKKYGVVGSAIHGERRTILAAVDATTCGDLDWSERAKPVLPAQVHANPAVLV